jgi:hypothetical protein
LPASGVFGIEAGTRCATARRRDADATDSSDRHSNALKSLLDDERTVATFVRGWFTSSPVSMQWTLDRPIDPSSYIDAIDPRQANRPVEVHQSPETLTPETEVNPIPAVISRLTRNPPLQRA